MTDLDEAVKRLEESVERRSLPFVVDIRTVLDALSEAQADVEDLATWRDSALNLMAGLEAVIERAKSILTPVHPASLGPVGEELVAILNTAPVDALRERDAALLERHAGFIREREESGAWSHLSTAAIYLYEEASELRNEQP